MHSSSTLDTTCAVYVCAFTQLPDLVEGNPQVLSCIVLLVNLQAIFVFLFFRLFS